MKKYGVKNATYDCEEETCEFLNQVSHVMNFLSSQ